LTIIYFGILKKFLCSIIITSLSLIIPAVVKILIKPNKINCTWISLVLQQVGPSHGSHFKGFLAPEGPILRKLPHSAGLRVVLLVVFVNKFRE